MPTIIERRLEFVFPDDWQVAAYDRQANSATGEPASFYRRVVEKGGVQQVRDMDIVCRLPHLPERLQLIEVKDDRMRQPVEPECGACGKQKEPRHVELFRTVMQKTAGTLAGLLLAERLGDESLRAHACLSQGPAITAVLYLLEPAPPTAPATPGENNLYRLPGKERKTGLDQRLTEKMDEWGIRFYLYDDTPARQPPDWHMREVPPPTPS
ncbi:MAG: hypothetical protein ACRYFK_01075 [Janthinobacterium lividum]